MKTIEVYKRVPMIFLKLILVILSSTLSLVLVIIFLPVLWNKQCRDLLEKIAHLVSLAYEL